MGWTGLYHQPPDIPAYFKVLWETTQPTFKTICLNQAFVGRFVLYGLWETTYTDGEIRRWASVTLISYSPTAKDGCVFYYKDMDETVGPCEAACPKTILQKLTKAYNPYALAWRKACWQHSLGLSSSAIWKQFHKLKANQYESPLATLAYLHYKAAYESLKTGGLSLSAFYKAKEAIKKSLKK